MSLIADALKAAQWERSGADATSRRHRAASDLVGRAIPGPTAASRIPLPRTGIPTSTRVALGVLVVAVMVAGALVLHGRGARRSGIEAIAVSPPEQPTPGASQRDLAQALLGGRETAAERATVPGGPTDGGEDGSGPEAGPGGPETEAAYRGFMEEPVVAASSTRAAPGDRDASAEARRVAQEQDTPGRPVAPPVAGQITAVAEQVSPPPADGFHLTLGPALPEGREFGKAVEAQARGDHPGAVELYLRLLDRQPGNARAYNNLGTSYQALGRLELARQAYRRAVDLDPAYAAGWSNLAGALAALGEKEEAQSALAESIRLDPSNRAAKVNLANEYAADGSHTEARRLLEEVLRAEPAMAEAHYALARVMEATGDRAAVREYRRFLETAGDRFPHLLGPVRDRITRLEKGGR